MSSWREGPGYEIARQLSNWPEMRLSSYFNWMLHFYPDVVNENKNIWSTDGPGGRAMYHPSRYNDAYQAALSQGWVEPTFGFDGNVNLIVNDKSQNTLNPDWYAESQQTAKDKPFRPPKIDTNTGTIGKGGKTQSVELGGARTAGISFGPIIIIAILFWVIRLIKRK